MFRFHKTLDVVTLFHKTGSPTSTKVFNLLKQVNANASQSATEDQASDHTGQTRGSREEFELNITEDAPTTDQVKTILEYAGPDKVSSIVSGAKTVSEGLKKFHTSPDSFQRPVVVDWNNGKAIAGDNESAILKMLEDLKKR